MFLFVYIKQCSKSVKLSRWPENRRRDAIMKIFDFSQHLWKEFFLFLDRFQLFLECGLFGIQCGETYKSFKVGNKREQ